MIQMCRKAEFATIYLIKVWLSELENQTRVNKPGRETYDPYLSIIINHQSLITVSSESKRY